jgi:hypothetical protein
LNASFFAALAFQASAVPGAPPPEQRPLESTVMIVEFVKGARYIGLPRRCPGSTGEVDPDEEICFAELYEGPVRIVRHLVGPRVRRGTHVRLIAHSRRWPKGTRMLVATVPFRNGQASGAFAYWWDTPEVNGDFCYETAKLPESPDEPVTRAFAAGYGRRFKALRYTEKADFRCIRD